MSNGSKKKMISKSQYHKNKLEKTLMILKEYVY